jgi:hypothetical protein
MLSIRMSFRPWNRAAFIDRPSLFGEPDVIEPPGFMDVLVVHVEPSVRAGVI